MTNEPVSNEKKPSKSSGLLLGLIGVLVLVVIGLGAYVAGRETTSKSESPSVTKSSSAASSAPKYDYGILNQITDTLNREYVKPDNLNGQVLANAALAGLLNPLNDSGTYYLDPTAYKNSQAAPGSLGDPGIIVASGSGGLTIGDMLPGSSAASASGLKVNDIIANVDGESTSGWSAKQAALRLAGQPNTQVKISVRSKEDPKPREFTLDRRQPTSSLVSATPPPGGLKNTKGDTAGNVSYVRISDFTAATQDQLSAALKNLPNGGSGPLVLDLRDNPGTDVKAGLAAANLFVESPNQLAITQDSSGKETPTAARSGTAMKHGQVVVLVNPLTSSGAELFAAALHDNGQATIVGQKSAGHASNSDVKQLDNGGAIFVSTSVWLGPKHELIEKAGLTPDIEIQPDPTAGDPQLARALDVLGG